VTKDIVVNEDYFSPAIMNDFDCAYPIAVAIGQNDSANKLRVIRQIA